MSRKFQVKAVPSSWIEQEGRRLDCGPYMSGAMEARALLQKISVRKETLQSLTGGMEGIVNAGRITRLWVDDPAQGYPFLSSTDILQIDLSSVSYIAKSVARQNNQLLIKDNWTLITRSGTIGRMAYSRSDMAGMACTEDVLRVKPDENKIKPGYIYAYLSTKFGVPLIVSGTYGSIITHLEPSHIADLPVPRIGIVEEHAHGLIQRSAELRVQAAAQIEAATKHYLHVAGLEDISPVHWIENSGRLGFSTHISNNILRAVNYIPLNIALRDTIRQKCKKWKNLIDVVKPGTLKRGPRFLRADADPDFGIELLGQREAFALRPSGRHISKIYIPDNDLLKNPDGGIVIAAHGGLKESDSFCRSQFLHGKRLEYLYSEDFLRAFPDENEILGGALFSYLRSEICFRLLRGCAIGSIQQEFHPTLISQIPVPIIDPNEARSIDATVRDAYSKYDEAIDCEDQARALVERTIENGGR
jgi:hypothetical protein